MNAKCLLLIGILAALVVPASASADAITDLNSGFTGWFTVAADQSRFVYTVADGTGLSETTAAGTRELIPAAPQNNLEVYDVGTDSRGRTLAVYSRCPRTTRPDCDLYALDLAPGSKERRMRVSSSRCSENDAELDNGVLVFSRARKYGSKQRCATGVYLKRPGKRARRLLTGGQRDFSYARGWLAYMIEKSKPAEDEGSTYDTFELRVRRLGSAKSRRVAFGHALYDGRAGEFIGLPVWGPVVDGHSVYWRRERTDRGQVDIMRSGLGAGSRRLRLSREGRGWHTQYGDAILGFDVFGGHIAYELDQDFDTAYPGRGPFVGRVAPEPAVFAPER